MSKGKTLVTTLATVYDRSMDVAAAVAAVLLSMVMLLVTVSVIARYFFNNPMAWVLELSEYSLLYATFLGAPWLLRKGGHIKVDIISSALGPRKRGMLNTCTSLLCAVTCLVLAYNAALVTLTNMQRGVILIKILEIPKFVLLVVIPLGSVFLLVEFLRIMRRSWAEAKADKPATSPETEPAIKAYY